MTRKILHPCSTFYPWTWQGLYVNLEVSTFLYSNATFLENYPFSRNSYTWNFFYKNKNHFLYHGGAKGKHCQPCGNGKQWSRHCCLRQRSDIRCLSGWGIMHKKWADLFSLPWPIKKAQIHFAASIVLLRVTFLDMLENESMNPSILISW